MFIDFVPGNITLIFFHCRESVGCRRILSHFLPFACHVRFFASSLMANNRLNLGYMGRYHNMLTGGPFVSSSKLFPPNLFLNCDNSHVRHAFNATNSSLYNTPSLRHLCIFLYSKPIGHRIFFAL